MAKSRHFNRTKRGLGEHPQVPTDPSLSLPAEMDADAFAVASADEEVAPNRPWNSVRSSKVARARQLVQDPGYPSSEVLRSVAGLLSQHLTSDQ